MKTSLFIYKSSQISYYCFGSGVRPVLCFHGYGENGSTYQFLEKHIGEQYIFFALDLPFHGETQWKEGLRFSIDDLLEIIDGIFRQHGISPSTSFSAIGFSLGGRMVLSLYEAKPDLVEKMVLLAPDGLKVNFWYWLATRTWIGTRLFSFTMKRPGWFFFLLKILNKLRLANTSIYKFVNHYIGDQKVRRELYERWMTLRKLSPDRKKIKSLITKYRTATRLLYGQHDRIILPTRGEQFRKGIEDYCTLTIIPSGHQVLHERHAGEIVAALFH